MVKHAMTMQPYLTTKCNVSTVLVFFIFRMFEILTGKLNMDVDSEAAMCFCAVICQSQNDFMVICNVAKILELVVPLMEHPSGTFLTTIEEDLMKLIIKYGMTVGLVCSSLLSEVALKTTNSV